jgi:hypothetical protein
MGNTVAKTTAENAATQINTDNLVAGYYFLHITNNIESRTIKVLKK